MRKTRLIILSNAIQAHPDTVLGLVGFGIDRVVYLNGRLLKPDRSYKVNKITDEGFNWGYHGKGCEQLALAILLKVRSRAFAVKFYKDFEETFISFLPSLNFNVDINFTEWLRHLYKMEAGEKPSPIHLADLWSFHAVPNIEHIPVHFGVKAG